MLRLKLEYDYQICFSTEVNICTQSSTSYLVEYQTADYAQP